MGKPKKGRPKKVPKFREFAEDWIAHLYRKNSPSAPTYEYRIQHLIRYESPQNVKVGFGRRRIDKITTEDLQFWQDVIIANFEGSTPRSIVALMARLLREARRKGYQTPEMPAEKPKATEAVPGAKARKPLREDQVALFMTHGFRLGIDRKSWWLLFLFTGLRLSEARALRWFDIDFRAKPLGRILAACQLGRDGNRKATKTKEVRQIPIHPQLLPFLECWKAASVKSAASDHVIVDYHGHQPSSDTIRRNFSEDLLTLGIPEPHTPHHMRHTFCTLLSAVDGIQHEWSDRITHAPNTRRAINAYRETNYPAMCREFQKWRVIIDAR